MLKLFVQGAMLGQQFECPCSLISILYKLIKQFLGRSEGLYCSWMLIICHFLYLVGMPAINMPKNIAQYVALYTLIREYVA